MSLTISIIAICYVAVLTLVLKTFRYMRDRNIAEPEVHHIEKNFKQTA